MSTVVRLLSLANLKNGFDAKLLDQDAQGSL